MSEDLKLSTDDFLVREGEDSNNMYYLVSGTMGVYRVRNNQDEQIGTVYSGELVGEMSFLDNEPRSASVKALSDCVLTVIPRSKMESVIKSQPKWYQALLNTVLMRLRKANSRIRV